MNQVPRVGLYHNEDPFKRRRRSVYLSGGVAQFIRAPKSNHKNDTSVPTLGICCFFF